MDVPATVMGVVEVMLHEGLQGTSLYASSWLLTVDGTTVRAK